MNIFSRALLGKNLYLPQGNPMANRDPDVPAPLCSLQEAAMSNAIASIVLFPWISGEAPLS
jgi:hypothetical protein